MWTRRIFPFLSAAACAAGAALGQPPAPDKPQPPAQQGIQTPEEERAALKARLDRWLADNKRTQDRLEAAIKKFDAGAPTNEVRAEIEGARFPRGQDRADQPRGPRGPRIGGDQGPEHGPPPTDAGKKMSREEVLEFLGKEFPEISKRFQDALKDNPNVGSRVLDRMEPMIREIMTERDPDMRALRHDNFQNGADLMAATRDFIESHRKEPQADTTQQKADKLRTLLGAHFDLQIKIHQQEIVVLEKRIKQLRDDLEKQLPERQKFIDKRIEDLMNRPARHQERPAPQTTPGS